jgi:hypothetical protein
MSPPDLRDRSHKGLAAFFRHFARTEAPQLDSALYEAFCDGVADDAELLAIAARAQPGQTPVNMMFAAVQFLLLRGEGRELAAHYPTLSGCPAPGLERSRTEIFPLFRAFCLDHRDEIEELVATRRVQTNVIQRCVCLVPAFATVVAEAADDRPLSLIEIGPSAGLNLQWDRYRYVYPTSPEATTWGHPGSTVKLTTELRGEQSLPSLAPPLEVAWRSGIDVRPVDLADADAVTWLRALIWPEHVERHARLRAAIDIARSNPIRLLQGDAVDALPAIIAEAPKETLLAVFATFALYQIPRDRVRLLLASMQSASKERDIAFVSIESSGTHWSEVYLTWYRRGDRATRKLAHCNPHGRWLEWRDATLGADETRAAPPERR